MTGVFFTEPFGTPADAWKIWVTFSYNDFEGSFDDWLPPWAKVLLEVLRSMSYKPWYGLQAHMAVYSDDTMADMPAAPPEVQYSGSYLGLAFRAPNASQFGAKYVDIKKIGRRVIVPPRIMRTLPKEYMRGWVRDEIHKLEQHEADEFLRFNGERLRTPH